MKTKLDLELNKVTALKLLNRLEQNKQALNEYVIELITQDLNTDTQPEDDCETKELLLSLPLFD